MAKRKMEKKDRTIIALSVIIALLLILVVLMFIYFNTGITSSDGNVIVQLG